MSGAALSGVGSLPSTAGRSTKMGLSGFWTAPRGGGGIDGAEQLGHDRAIAGDHVGLGYAEHPEVDGGSPPGVERLGIGELVAVPERGGLGFAVAVNDPYQAHAAVLPALGERLQLGASSRQGTHHDAQKFTTTTSPR